MAKKSRGGRMTAAKKRAAKKLEGRAWSRIALWGGTSCARKVTPESSVPGYVLGCPKILN